MTAGSLNAYTKQEVNSLVTAETVEREKQDSALGGMIAAETTAREQAVATKQDTLVSGQNIKTINGENILGEGNIVIQGGTSNWDDIQGKPEFATVATTGSYNDLTDTPSLDSYATKAELAGKQDTLVSGTNIKTINNQSLLGSGNIQIEGGGTITVDSELSTTSENPVQNKVITTAINNKQDAGDYALRSEIPDTSDLATKSELAGKLDTATYNSEKESFETKENAAATYQTKGDYATTAQLNGKQDALVSGTNIKTINGNSILGEGDLEISDGSEAKVWDWNEVSSSPADFYNNAKAGDLLNGYANSRAITTYAPTVITSVKSENGGDSKAYSLLFAHEENPFILNLIVSSNRIESADEFDIIDPTTKQNTLVSGTNIKTVNGESLLGAGDIVISGGGTVDTVMSDTSENAVQNKVIKAYIDGLIGEISARLDQINGEVIE